uniref:OCIA domain-containing protein n=2 Tax=Macrostomum lignano TaxID=282301 RepID=A0A1I8IDI3_9PLAT
FEVVDLLLSFRSSNNSPVASPNEPQYATHLQDSVDGDFHAFPLYMLLLRRSVFQAATPMQQAGWVPGKAFAMPLRRRFERRLIYYRDWLDAALALHSSRPSFPLAALVNSVTSCPGYCYSRFPVESVAKPKASDDAAAKNSKSNRISRAKNRQKKSGKSGKAGKGQVDPAVYARQPGAMEFGDQPLSVPVIGVKSLASLCDLADRLRQTKQRAADIRELLREARADGLNTEVLMAQALDDIKPDPKPEDSNENNCSTKTQPPSNSNNHAAAEKKKKSNMQSPDEAEHCSEPLRIVLLGLERERCRQQCMEAVSVYVHRRSYFGFGQQLDPEHGRCRDVRNMVVCLLNSIGCEQAAIDSIVQSIRAGHPRWRALEAVKQQRTSAIARISALMTAILISSKEIVDFLAKDSYPPYAPNSVDFELHPRVATAMTSIRYGIVRDLNASRDAWKYLTPEMLTEVVQNSAVLLHFKVGKRPSKAMMDEYKKKLDMQIKKKNHASSFRQHLHPRGITIATTEFNLMSGTELIDDQLYVPTRVHQSLRSSFRCQQHHALHFHRFASPGQSRRSMTTRRCITAGRISSFRFSSCVPPALPQPQSDVPPQSYPQFWSSSVCTRHLQQFALVTRQSALLEHRHVVVFGQNADGEEHGVEAQHGDAQAFGHAPAKGRNAQHQAGEHAEQHQDAADGASAVHGHRVGRVDERPDEPGQRQADCYIEDVRSDRAGDRHVAESLPGNHDRVDLHLLTHLLPHIRQREPQQYGDGEHQDVHDPFTSPARPTNQHTSSSAARFFASAAAPSVVGVGLAASSNLRGCPLSPLTALPFPLAPAATDAAASVLAPPSASGELVTVDSSVAVGRCRVRLITAWVTWCIRTPDRAGLTAVQDGLAANRNLGRMVPESRAHYRFPAYMTFQDSPNVNSLNAAILSVRNRSIALLLQHQLISRVRHQLEDAGAKSAHASRVQNRQPGGLTTLQHFRLLTPDRLRQDVGCAYGSGGADLSWQRTAAAVEARRLRRRHPSSSVAVAIFSSRDSGGDRGDGGWRGGYLRLVAPAGPDQGANSGLYLLVELHEQHVGGVAGEQRHGLVPVDAGVSEGNHQQSQRQHKQQSRNRGHQVSCRTPREKKAHMLSTNRMLNTALPTMVPMPTSLADTKEPRNDVASSGAEPPAAINVAPATSFEMRNRLVMTERLGTKNSSQTMANAQNMLAAGLEMSLERATEASHMQARSVGQILRERLIMQRDGANQSGELALTDLDRELLRQCQQESFYRRCLPFSAALTLVTFWRHRLGHYQKFIALRYLGSIVAGNILGRVSYLGPDYSYGSFSEQYQKPFSSSYYEDDRSGLKSSDSDQQQQPQQARSGMLDDERALRCLCAPLHHCGSCFYVCGEICCEVVKNPAFLVVFIILCIHSTILISYFTFANTAKPKPGPTKPNPLDAIMALPEYNVFLKVANDTSSESVHIGSEDFKYPLLVDMVQLVSRVRHNLSVNVAPINRHNFQFPINQADLCKPYKLTGRSQQKQQQQQQPAIVLMMSSFSWMIAHCQGARFAFFLDDDYVVNPLNLVRFADAIPPESYAGTMAGFVWRNAAPVRRAPKRNPQSRWLISYREYPWPMYPAYVSAGAFLVSMPVIKDFTIAMEYTRYLRFDDVFLGILMHKLRIVPLHAERIHSFSPVYPDSPSFPGLIASHGYARKADKVRAAWSEILNRTGAENRLPLECMLSM